MTDTSALQGPGWFPRWAPTSDLELYQAEAAILNPIRPMISQRTVAGRNTICSLHEKVPADQLIPTDPSDERLDPSPPTSPVDALPSATRSGFWGSKSTFTPPSVSQQVQLCPVDRDNYTSIVFIHGYAGGVANWLPAWKTYARENDLYAFDIPGFGRNPRPNVTFTTSQAAIDWYVAAFEEWFAAMRIGMEGVKEGGQRPAGRKLVIVAHSFGGYLSSHFVSKHPNLVDHLVLVDAWGINRYAPRTAEQEEHRKKNMSAPLRYLDHALEGIYWGKLLLSCGPIARRLLPIMRPEFAETWAPFVEDPNHFYDYCFHCVSKRPFSGEVAFEAIRVKEGISAAQLPLIDHVGMFPSRTRSQEVENGKAPASPYERMCPTSPAAIPIAGEGSSLRDAFKISMIYGDQSWLRCDALDEFAERLRKENGIPVFFRYVEKAGHFPLADNVSEFCEVLSSRLAAP